jgi:hypothetical protein
MNGDIRLPESDPLEHLLAGRPESASAGVRQAVLRRTAWVLRRRRWTRRAVWAVLLAGCYAAGVLTPHGPSRPAVVAPTDQGQNTPVTSAPSPRREPSSAKPDDSALALEWQAVEGDGDRAALYRRAGQRYLNDEGDAVGAVRCYSHALRNSAPENLTVHLDDDWLLMALKDARQKEIRNANSTP